MSTLAVPYNIQSYAAALAEGLQHGDMVHVGVCGNHTTDAVFSSFLDQSRGIVIGTQGRRIDLLWGDIVELWLLEEKPNIYHSDVPEVVGVLKSLKAAVQKCVEADNGAGVLYLLDQVAEAKKAEPLFREARSIVAGIRI
jgi:hypothetical protein